MTPEQLVTNATTIAKALVPGLGILAGAVGTAAYVAGKMGSNPSLMSMGKNGWIGALVAACATAVYAVIANVGSRLGGG